MLPLLQSQSVTWVPLVCVAPGTSRHRPEPAPVNRNVVGVVPPPEPGVTERLSNCAATAVPVAYPTWPVPKAESVTEPTVLPSTVAVIVLPLKPSEKLCQRPVPTDAIDPLARVRTLWLVLLLRIDHEPPSVTRR